MAERNLKFFTIMEDYSLSVSILRKAKSYGMKAPEYLIYADLRASGWSQRDAWAVAFQGKGINWAKAELEREMNKLESLGSVQKRIAEVQGEKAGKEELSPEELAKATSKEQILADLVIARRRMKEGSKEWGDYTKMIGDFAKIKQDELQTEDTTIHYYLPANYPDSCANCLLFQNGKAAFPEKKT